MAKTSNSLDKILRPYINKAIRESIRQFMSPSISYRVDEMTLHTLLEDARSPLLENANWILRKRNWEVNNYQRFLDIIRETPSDKKGFLTWHGMDEITQDDWITYTLKGYDVAFALHYIAKGQVDICNLVNNTAVQAERENDPSKVLKGVGNEILQFAKMEGGTQMDNYRGEDGSNGFLGDKYRKAGFDRQTWSDKFNPEFQPADKEWQFDTEKYGFPDVEGLESSKHRMRYNSPNRNYKQRFDDRMDKKFGKNR